jgi:hypothetical protein
MDAFAWFWLFCSVSVLMIGITSMWSEYMSFRRIEITVHIPSIPYLDDTEPPDKSCGCDEDGSVCFYHAGTKHDTSVKGGKEA